MQMAAFFSESAGLFVQTKDPNGSLSDWEILPGEALRLHFYGPEPEIETKAIAPTIEAAAEPYKRWATQQSWAAPNKRASLGLSLIAVASNPTLERQLASIRLLAEKFPTPIGAWLTQWRRYAFDTMYPDYEPSDSKAFADLLSNLKRLRCITFPYMNALLMDERLKSFGLRESVALRARDGSLVHYSKKLPWLVYACPAAQIWQDTILGSRRSLKDAEGVLSSGIYLDMLVAAGPFLCFASNHGHEPGDPLAWQQGVMKILRSTEGVIMSEGNAEIYANQVDALLMHLYTDRPDTVPLWKLVYGDLTASVGWYMPSSPSPEQLEVELARAKRFGVSCHGSPWMTHVVQEALLTPSFDHVLRSVGGR
jgi:hypothetical protein